MELLKGGRIIGLALLPRFSVIASTIAGTLLRRNVAARLRIGNVARRTRYRTAVGTRDRYL